MFIYLSVIMFLPRQRTRLEHRIICYCIYCSCSYIFLFTQKSTMALTCLSSAYLGATTSLKKPQSLLWMTRCLVISFFFFWSKTITAWRHLTCLIWQFLPITIRQCGIYFFIVFFLSAMLIWSLLWAAPHRSVGMTVVCCMESREFKLQADCQPVFWKNC